LVVFKLKYDLIVIGAGAAGFMAAITAAKNKKSVLLIDSNKKLCEKIRISGGGRCNFTNINASDENYISQNPFFVKSALAQYGPYDFIKFVEENNIKFHEKKLGQMFCNEGSFEIINLLKQQAQKFAVTILHPVKINEIYFNELALKINIENKSKEQLDFSLEKKIAIKIGEDLVETDNLIIATGGLSIPQLGTSSFAYDLAKLLAINVIEPKAGLVPILINDKFINENSGASFDVKLAVNKHEFRENILMTHKGLSGPATLQISNYWQMGDKLVLNFCPDLNLQEYFLNKKSQTTNEKLIKIISEIEQKKNMATFTNKIDRDFVFSKNFLKSFSNEIFDIEKNIQEYSKQKLIELANLLNAMSLSPCGDEGFAKAEVTKGGIDTNALDQKTMQVKQYPGLYFIGEAVDVTGWLGGYNFQWAWSSAFCAAQSL
jgi:predicted Rossmann fold flavoprotein